MRRLIQLTLTGAGVMSIILLASVSTSAQKLPKRIFIQAQAMGQAQQLGRSYSINLIIEELSTMEERAGLLEAFKEKGNEGLVNALHKMKSKGRLSLTGTLGYDVAYIMRFNQPDGSTMLRVVTDRPLRFGEVYSDSRSSDYNLSALEIVISADKKKTSGTLFPAVELKLNKEGRIELETFQNPWKLVNIRRR